ncbi:MAG: hypothetical protein FJZ09_05175 [Candidatus Omnitrophica bacterium]|nr:hypothetical protein [Candidatus Omnitrophota bacterium]
MGLKGHATGIGSMPHPDAEKALDLIFKYAPKIPFWPQLPKRDFREGMVVQYSEGLPFLKVSGDGVAYSALEARERDLEIFYERIIACDAEYFRISPEFAQGLHAFYRRLKEKGVNEIEAIKCQIVGPFSFLASVKDESGGSLLHDAVFSQVAIKALAMKALWQVNLFKEFGKQIIIFIDEPYLGAFGSAYTPINREDVVRSLSDLASGIKDQAKVMLGLHCCGNTDWSMLAEIKGLDIISFDAFDFLEKFLLYAPELKSFLGRGGFICWGIVPTQSFSGSETPEALSAKILEAIDILAKKGLDRQRLLDQLLISPACGLGTLETEKAVRILEVLSLTSARLERAL